MSASLTVTDDDHRPAQSRVTPRSFAASWEALSSRPAPSTLLLTPFDRRRDPWREVSLQRVAFISIPIRGEFMKLPLQITTRNVSLSEAATTIIREKVTKLETFYDSI